MGSVCVRAQWCLTLWDFIDCRATRFLFPWNFLGKNAGAGFHFLFQGIFPHQGLNPCLPHWQVNSCQWLGN